MNIKKSYDIFQIIEDFKHQNCWKMKFDHTITWDNNHGYCPCQSDLWGQLPCTQMCNKRVIHKNFCLRGGQCECDGALYIPPTSVARIKAAGRGNTEKARASAPWPQPAPTLAWPLHSRRPLVHLNHIECTSFSRSKIQ